MTADGTGLEFLADGCADGVIAEDRTLSRHLAAEALVAGIARVLRPGGQLLACVDSLTYGMGVLAEQHRWPHLVDVPNADVVLIPWPDGTITRCYGAEQLRELFTGAGLRVSWIRPRTVLSPETVGYLLARDPSRFAELVERGATRPLRRLGGNAADRVLQEAEAGPAGPYRTALPGCRSAAPVPLPLAGDTAGGRRADLKAGLGNRVTAVDAPPVAAVVHPGKRGEHLGALRERRLHRRGVPVRLRQVRARVARLRATPSDKVVFTHQYRNRPVQVGAHFL